MLATVTNTDLTVWIISGLLALGVGWTRLSKWRTNDRIARELAAMTPEQRAKVLSRMNPAVAMEMRQQLLDRFRIMS
ncbi:MAG: DUF3106 domain-containing protein [Verrucomicrobiota bacterium]|nr:DUF3106 domain-containing protein [Verrucomicrobiota bacterium]